MWREIGCCIQCQILPAVGHFRASWHLRRGQPGRRGPARAGAWLHWGAAFGAVTMHAHQLDFRPPRPCFAPAYLAGAVPIVPQLVPEVPKAWTGGQRLAKLVPLHCVHKNLAPICLNLLQASITPELMHLNPRSPPAAEPSLDS